MKERKPPPVASGRPLHRVSGCTYSWRNCLSRSLRVGFPCQNVPPTEKGQPRSVWEGSSSADFSPCGACQNCKVFSWSHLEATAWLAAHIIGVGSFYYCCLIPYFDENHKYVKGLTLVVPGSSDDKLTARLAQSLFEILLPLRRCLRLLYSLFVFPFQLLYRLTSISLFLYIPSPTQGTTNSAQVAGLLESHKREDAYLLDNSDDQFSSFRSSAPLILLVMSIHGALSFLLRKYLYRLFLSLYSTSPSSSSVLSLIGFKGRRQTSTEGSTSSRRRNSRVHGTDVGSSTRDDEERLCSSEHVKSSPSLQPRRSSSLSTKQTWIATQSVYTGFELVLGLGFGLYLHSAHLFVLLLYSLVNYSITLLLPVPSATSVSARGSSRPSGNLRREEHHQLKKNLNFSESTSITGGSAGTSESSQYRQGPVCTPEVGASKTSDRLRCALVIILTFGFHFALLLYHGSTVHFSLSYIHPSLLPLEVLFFSFLSPIYSLHDCVRLVVLKMVSFNLDKVWSLRLHQNAAHQITSVPVASAGDANVSSARLPNDTEHEAHGKKKLDEHTEKSVAHLSSSSVSPAFDVEGKPGTSSEDDPSPRKRRSYVFNSLQCPNPFGDERFFPSDSANIPYGTYTSVVRYLAYVFYTPTYLAGPIVTYNSWNRQSAFPWWVIVAHNTFLVADREETKPSTPRTESVETKTCLPDADKSTIRGVELVSTSALADAETVQKTKTRETPKCVQKDNAADTGVCTPAGHGYPFDLMVSPHLLDLPFSVYGKIFLGNVLPYFLRWLLAMLLLEIHMRYLPVNALVTRVQNFPLWRQMQLRELLIMSVTVLCFMWFKFFCLWRLCRLWSILAGVVPPENMVRFLYNNYSTEKFWRGWHRSFNLYLIRYMYIPMSRLLASLPSFSVPLFCSCSRASSPEGEERLRVGAERKGQVCPKRPQDSDQRRELETIKRRGAGGGSLTGRCIASCFVFLYVAFWHEINLKVFLWGLACAACYVPEAILRYWAFPSPSARGRGVSVGEEREEKKEAHIQTHSGGDGSRHRSSEGQDQRYVQRQSDTRPQLLSECGVETEKKRKKTEKEKLLIKQSYQMKSLEIASRTPCLKLISRVVSTFSTDIRQKPVFKYVCILAGAANIFLLCFCNLVGYSYGAEGMQLIATRIREEGILSALRSISEVLFIFFLATGGMLVIRALEGGRKNY
ncbi:mboat related protein [Cystoisospora suis]|uniref:Mboat related protein n=1 Tax=Cystoisospora suis TaxID=483139 RepID=A0A2C6K921_9APIC|nr:mboat related protein [Cystoisospora suis]